LTVYLVDEPFLDIAAAYASRDPGALIVLLQDAVYSFSRFKDATNVFAVEDDIARRGLGSKVPKNIHTISYDGLVEMMEKDKVVNFL